MQPIGPQLNQEQIDAINSVAPTADDIFNNMDALNEEIAESYGIEASDSVEPAKKPKARASTKRRSSKASKAKTNVSKAKKETLMDLDSELDKLNEQATLAATQAAETTQAAEEVEDPADMKGQIIELLNKIPGAPKEAQINAWKAEHGANGVHVMALGEEDVYIFTHLKRGQWKKIQQIISKLQEAGSSSDLEDSLKEKVIQNSVLWPQLPIEFFYGSRAGVVDSLYQVILLNSYFLSPQQAMLLTTQL